MFKVPSEWQVAFIRAEIILTRNLVFHGSDDGVMFVIDFASVAMFVRRN